MLLSNYKDIYTDICAFFNRNSKNSKLTIEMLERLEKIGAVANVGIISNSVISVRISILIVYDNHKIRYDLYNISNTADDDKEIFIMEYELRQLISHTPREGLYNNKVYVIGASRKLGNDLSFEVCNDVEPYVPEKYHFANMFDCYIGYHNSTAICIFALWNSYFSDDTNDAVDTSTSLVFIMIDDHINKNLTLRIIKNVAYSMYNSKTVRVLESQDICEPNDVMYTIPIHMNISLNDILLM